MSSLSSSFSSREFKAIEEGRRRFQPASLLGKAVGQVAARKHKQISIVRDCANDYDPFYRSLIQRSAALNKQSMAGKNGREQLIDYSSPIQ